jgi:hypothetical protein
MSSSSKQDASMAGDRKNTSRHMDSDNEDRSDRDDKAHGL